MTTPRFTLLVPVKDGRGAKTRLGAVGSAGRAALMAAFARDAITAAADSPVVEVCVVGDAEALAPVVDGLDVTVVPDEGGGDLNEALRRAAARVGRAGCGLGVLLADLPCLNTDDLEAALVHEGRRYVADAAGTGTTLLLAPPGVALDPCFGRDSARKHAESGAVAIDDPLPTLRLDVDTTADLDRALVVGVGPHTAAVVARLPHLS